MKFKILDVFSLKLADQAEYIAKDKPQASRRIKKGILKALRS